MSHPPEATPTQQRRAEPDLRADCARCVGLCCVALAFARSADFAMSKEAGEPCVHLEADYRCDIHSRLRPEGFKGCTVFDCFGAGQQVTQVTYGGRSWRDEPAVAARMFPVFTVMRQLHELLWYLSQARRLVQPGRLGDELHRAYEQTERLTADGPEALLRLDIGAHRDAVQLLLARTSKHVRAAAVRTHDRRNALTRRARPKADLIGANLRRVDLRGADLRGAYLIAADLRSADLRDADLIGADLRDADLAGADLSTTLFLTAPQLSSATGDQATRLPAELGRPAHWA